jgi:ribonuclease HIII
MPDLSSLRRLLRNVFILLPLRHEKTQEFRLVFNEFCSFLFSKDVHNSIWDEGMLSQLKAIFSIQPPHENFSDQVKLLTERQETVKKINDLFFSIVDGQATAADLCESLSALGYSADAYRAQIESSNRLYEIRSTDSRVCEKTQAFLEFLMTDLGLDLKNCEYSMERVLETMRTQESEEGVNALLINKVSNSGILSKFSVKVQNGNGKTTSSVPTSEQFQKAVERARLALVEKGFARAADDVVFSLEVTEAEYGGESIALPAAVGIYVASRKNYLDPYSAFTGDINLSGLGGQYVIKGVQGIQAKLDAAILNGCRRIFVPSENAAEISQIYRDQLRIHFIENLIDVLLILQKSTDPLPGDTAQIRKINSLKAECIRRGLQLSEGVTIPHGVQFTVSSLTPPEMKISIYSTGKHSASPQTQSDLQEILGELSKLDIPKIPLQNVNKTLVVKDAAIREEIQKELIALKPSITRQEQNCDYSFLFEDGQEKIVIKQFTKGTLQLQGRGGHLYRRLIETVLRIYNLRYPASTLELNQFVDNSAVDSSVKWELTTAPQAFTVPLPHIGTDESGKGDYFGSMVIAGVWIDDSLEKELSSLHLKDSKLLSDRQCQKLAQEIRSACLGKFEEVEITPERYNALYEEFRSKGKNLNHLLAWGHARAIESLLERVHCLYAVADQFGDEKYIKSNLMEKGKELNLIQTPKAERFIAVAAASILARDKFLSRMAKLSAEYGITLPKGASNAVVEVARRIQKMKGEHELRRVAKLHHRTTSKISPN